MRNSSLVEYLRAENLPGLSIVPKLRIRDNGRGAFHERRSYTERSGGANGSENAGVSNDIG